VPKRFVDETLWPQFQRASQERRRRLDKVASKVIEQALEAKDADTEEGEGRGQERPFVRGRAESETAVDVDVIVDGDGDGDDHAQPTIKAPPAAASP
jgi:hypothetical protein